MNSTTEERIGERIMEHMAATMSEEEWVRMFAPNGLARHTEWLCEDGWLVGYTTERIRGGNMDGKFAAFTYKPTGKGARTGKAQRWQRTYIRAFATRKAAKKRATDLYYKHSPKAAARHGVTV